MKGLRAQGTGQGRGQEVRHRPEQDGALKRMLDVLQRQIVEWPSLSVALVRPLRGSRASSGRRIAIRITGARPVPSFRRRRREGSDSRAGSSGAHGSKPHGQNVHRRQLRHSWLFYRVLHAAGFRVAAGQLISRRWPSAHRRLHHRRCPLCAARKQASAG